MIGAAMADGTGAWSFNSTGTSLGEGTHSFTATDTAGNSSAVSATFTVVERSFPGGELRPHKSRTGGIASAGGRFESFGNRAAGSDAGGRPIFDAALHRLEQASAPPESVADLSTLALHTADLEGDLLAEAHAGAIVLDVNAAGIGWFLDPTPATDEEFAADAAGTNPNAVGGIDLLSVILHELGHHLGGDHLNVADHPEHFLADRLAPGQRRLPKPEELDLLFADSDLLQSLIE